MGENLSPLNTHMQAFFSRGQAYFAQYTGDPARSQQMTLQSLGNLRQQQAASLAYFQKKRLRPARFRPMAGLNCHGEMTHGRNPHEARRRCPVVWDAQHAATGTIGDRTEAATRIGPADTAVRLTKLRKLFSCQSNLGAFVRIPSSFP